MSSSNFNITNTFAARLASIQARKTSQLKKTKEVKKLSNSVNMFLPGLDSSKRAMPNHIARSSIFAPVALGRKLVYNGTSMTCRKDAEIWFWGEQLDEAQADIWMQIMYLAGKQPLGEPVFINRADLLRSINRNTGKTQYDWLKSSIESLTNARLALEVSSKGNIKLSITANRALHFIDSFYYNEEANNYTLQIDPRWKRMYGNHEYALIDWEKHKKIRRGQDMAKAIQLLLATSTDSVQRYQVEWLKRKFVYGGRMRDFINALSSAATELNRVAIIKDSRIELSTKSILQATWSKF
jgi:hypothetical protein